MFYASEGAVYFFRRIDPEKRLIKLCQTKNSAPLQMIVPSNESGKSPVLFSGGLVTGST